MAKWFRKKKLKYMELTVDSRNKLGLKAWKDAGFREMKKEMWKKI
jgi:ribosomal protein S18 acetylase RimI-like enzyme